MNVMLIEKCYKALYTEFIIEECITANNIKILCFLERFIDLGQ